MSIDDVIYYRCEHDMARLACPTCRANYAARTDHSRIIAAAQRDLMARRPWYRHCAFCASPDGHTERCLWFNVADALTVNPEVEQIIQVLVASGRVVDVKVSIQGRPEKPLEVRSMEQFTSTFGRLKYERDLESNVDEITMGQVLNPLRGLKSGLLGDTKRGPLDAPIVAASFEEFKKEYDCDFVEDTNPPLPHPPVRVKTPGLSRVNEDGSVTTEIAEFKDGDFGEVLQEVINFSVDIADAFAQTAKAIAPDSLKDAVASAKEVMAKQAQPDWVWRPSDGPPITHVLKTESSLFWDMVHDLKHFEVRKNDRNFRVNDTLKLQELSRHHPCEPTGRYISARVTYILNGGQYGLQKGYVVMGLDIKIVSTKRGMRAKP